MSGDRKVFDHITALIDEEQQIRQQLSATGDAAQNAERLKHIEEQLDQCWDLLRQRRAAREFGGDPSQATARDVKTVEQYEG